MEPTKLNRVCVRIAFGVIMSLVCLCALLASCTSNHYFSVSADEMTNPRIEYKDSTNVTNPF